MSTTTRRHFIQNSAILALGAHSWSAQTKLRRQNSLLLVGTMTAAPSTSRGIYAYDFDAATGELKQIGLAAETESPTFLAVSPAETAVYSVNEVRQFHDHPTGSISGFSLNRKIAAMTPVNQVTSMGGGPTHIAMDKTGRCVFVANYGGGSVASFLVDRDGNLSEAVSFFQYTADTAKHERRPHAHRVTVSPDNRFLLVNDLGLDVIHIYRLDAATAKLTPHDPPLWRASPGYGPRALQFHPNGKWVYCVNELKPTVNLLGWDSSQGTLTTLQDVSLVPEGYQGKAAPADIVFDKSTRFAYVASRLDDFMATFAVSPETGRLTFLEKTTCGGQRPRHLTLDPSGRWLLVANQDSNNIAVFARSEKTGHLAETGKSLPLDRPMCLIFI
ncbi:lactonase family protein [Edaphobacter modestus]|uniref:6-phosphogluconolactonase n=1 Tax=Edaphobacter modestus TaxID=388466 RepID=A0A4Q7YN33_9BACT|nr:lactonase family protein [Edaphobacter modestus]RZU39007.1 6-phosphogluconolactonase [Edaphobacter modestus]